MIKVKKNNKKEKITRSTTAVDPWHLKIKEQDIRLTKIIELLSTFKKSAQFINSVLRSSRFQGLVN